MERRDFLQACAGGLACLPPLPAAAETLRPVRYARCRLTASNGAPLKASQLAVKCNYVFFYPYQGTPCFLLNLGQALAPAEVKAPGNPALGYRWPGGAGRHRSVVAYSAICSHRLAYPTRDISFISFRPGKEGAARFADAIHCCAEHSEYDPAAGAKVLSGPAPQPLAAVLLEHEPAGDTLYAVGTLGGEMFNEFFRRYEFKLAMDMGNRAKQAAEGSCPVTELERFCRQAVRC
jgi:Rieske Fe-S protein